MTDVIATDLQTQEIDSPIVDLFELTLPDGSIVYFHPGKDDNFADIQFKDKTADGSGNYTERTYTSIPVAMDGLEIQADGATSRPTISMANIGTTVLTGHSNLTYDDLVGMDVTRRQTLEKYLKGGSAYNSATNVPPVELNSVKYKVDRISSETNIAVVFELAVAYDLEGIQLPRRVVVGKYCSWMYQGVNLYGKGGCTASITGRYRYQHTNSVEFFTSFTDINNNFFVHDDDINIENLDTWTALNATQYTPNSYVKTGSTQATRRAWVSTSDHTTAASREPGTTGGEDFWKELRVYDDYNSSASYTAGALVKKDLTIGSKTLTAIFECIIDNTSSTPNRTPSLDTPYWERADLCGKTLTSCKCKFNTARRNNTTTTSLPSGRPQNFTSLPFGGFPGTAKF